MLRRIIFLTVLLVCFATSALAEDFLGAPVMPDGKEVARSDVELALTYDAAPEVVVKFYQDAYANDKEAKLRQRNGVSRYEDYSNRAWHKIVIVKDEQGKTSVTITKDSWTWISGMLILRFFGVFVVLLILFVAMTIATWAIRRATDKAPAPAAAK